MHKYELEGAQIITRAFFALSNNFKSSFKEITDETLKKLNVKFCLYFRMSQ